MFDTSPPPQETPSSNQPQSIDRKKRIASIFVATAILLICGAAFHFINIFAVYETIIYILLISSPLGIFIYRKTQARFQKFFLNLPQYNSTICFIAVYCLSIIILTLTINIYTDNSLPEKATFTVIEKHIYSHKSSKYYYADISMPTFVKLPYMFSTTEGIQVSKREYDRIDLGKTRIELAYHMGSLDFPWYEGYSLSGLLSFNPNINLDTIDTGNVDIQSACLWKSQFNPDKEIEKLTPNNYIRDFWQGGEPRSVEPMVDGLRHGIGHYTFANGKIYADIPWKHGQKHGVFTLYREDGTREQALSYKDGKVYGIEEWFDTNGNLTQSYLYLADEKPHDINLCSSEHYKVTQ
jgi:hypothetical protein